MHHIHRRGTEASTCTYNFTPNHKIRIHLFPANVTRIMGLTYA